MTCKELHEEITAFVDDRVDEEEYRKKVQQHITFCSDCRAAFERELMTKLAARNRSSRAGAPETLRASILEDVDRMSAERKEEIERRRRAVQGKSTWLDSFVANYVSPTGVAIALLLVIGGSTILFYEGGDTRHPVLADAHRHAPAAVDGVPVVPENFFNKAAKNFESILAGEFGLELETSELAELQSYFKSHGVTYDVVMPVRAHLAGGVISEHGRRNFAHMIFADGEKIVYLFEVPLEDLAVGDVVYVTADVLERLRGGEVIWEEPMGRPLAMFRKDNVVCCALANTSRPEMEQLMAMK